MATVSPVLFNGAYHAIRQHHHFDLAFEVGGEAHSLMGDWHNPETSALMPEGVAIAFLNAEIEHGTLQYVFYVDDVPIAFAGAFGLLTIPSDEFKNHNMDFLAARHRALDIMLELTSPYADG